MQDLLNHNKTIFIKINQETQFENARSFIKNGDVNERYIFQLNDNIQTTIEKVDVTRSEEGKGVFKLETIIPYAAGSKRFEALKTLIENQKLIYANSSLVTGTINEFINLHSKSWPEHGLRLLRLLRWRFNLIIDFEKLVESIFISVDRVSWMEFKPAFTFIPSVSSIPNTNYQYQEIQNLLDKNLEEPLAFDLLDEAGRLKVNNPRSAFALAVTALEIGTKQALKTFRPEIADYYYDKQAPPTEFIIKYLLPEFSNYRPDDQTIEEVKKIVHVRNQLIHKGAFDQEYLRVDTAIKFIRRLLYTFDLIQGRSWASAFCQSYTFTVNNKSYKV